MQCLFEKASDWICKPQNQLSKIPVNPAGLKIQQHMKIHFHAGLTAYNLSYISILILIVETL